MKKTNIFLVLVLMAVGILLTSCSKDDAEQSSPWAAETLWYRASQTYDTDKIDVLYFVSTDVLSAKDANRRRGAGRGDKFYKDVNVSRDNLHHWDRLFYGKMIHDNALRRAGRKL